MNLPIPHMRQPDKAKKKAPVSEKYSGEFLPMFIKRDSARRLDPTEEQQHAGVITVEVSVEVGNVDPVTLHISCPDMQAHALLATNPRWLACFISRTEEGMLKISRVKMRRFGARPGDEPIECPVVTQSPVHPFSAVNLTAVRRGR